MPRGLTPMSKAKLQRPAITLQPTVLSCQPGRRDRGFKTGDTCRSTDLSRLSRPTQAEPLHVLVKSPEDHRAALGTLPSS